ncbi:type II toxin-antitoxin system RelE/ParE family toxin [Candidatus Dependentiae bacterium]|nr:type II toxin-antitoxin system RelE/ParE family toxin [Candidatus Dependentiae bacterium]
MIMKQKELIWVGSSKNDLKDCPEDIKDEMGYALRKVQQGEQPNNAKVLKGFGSAGVLEIISCDESGTYRTVYTVKMAEVVFVLHIFQKKSKQGIKTPKKEMDLVESRLKQAQQIYKERYQK